jgi:hypothetical protein
LVKSSQKTKGQILPRKTIGSNSAKRNQLFKSRQQKPMVQIRTTKNNGSNPDNTQNQLFKSRQQNQWFKSGQQKTMFQIQKTINNGSNPDNKNPTNGSKHGINVTFKLNN